MRFTSWPGSCRSVRLCTFALSVCLILLAACGGSSSRQTSDVLVFGVAPDYDEIADKIVAVPADGGGLRPLTRGVPGAAYSPHPSPAGRHIAFSVSESWTPPESSAWVVNADGTQPRRLVPKKHGYSYAEAWSPDGDRVLYSLAVSEASGELVGRGLWTVGVDATGRRRLTPKGTWGDTAWSPDGSSLVYMTGEEGLTPDLHLLDVRSGRSRRLGRGSLPHWTPDGRRIVFKRAFAGNRSGFYVVDRDGGSARRIARFGPEEDLFLADVSPDGKWALVGYFPGISRISLDDGEVQELTDGEGDWAPAWSPDGEKIAFERDGAIWVMNADGSEERLVARPPRFRVFTRPFWLPQAGTEAAARDAS
jgi:Tol biopolymer transport system component